LPEAGRGTQGKPAIQIDLGHRSFLKEGNSEILAIEQGFLEPKILIVITSSERAESGSTFFMSGMILAGRQFILMSFSLRKGDRFQPLATVELASRLNSIIQMIGVDIITGNCSNMHRRAWCFIQSYVWMGTRPMAS